MGILYVVGTPIGHLGDMTFRAVDTLKNVDVIACEDTRVTRKLLQHYGIETRLKSYHAHSPEIVTERLLDELESGRDVALVTDAGTPLVSDPGADLVRGAIGRGLRVVPIPGASSVMTALSVSALLVREFLFLGFLPRSGGRRRAILEPLVDAPYTLVLFEAPGRLIDTLEHLRATLGEREVTVARELTKIFETLIHGTIFEVIDRIARPVRGEVVIVVGPPRPERREDRGSDRVEGADHDRIRDASAMLSAGMTPTEVAKAIAGAYGIAKRRAYELMLLAKADPAKSGIEQQDDEEQELEQDAEPNREEEPEQGPQHDLGEDAAGEEQDPKEEASLDPE